MGESIEAMSQAPEPELACSRCATPLAPETNFCPKCGHDLRGKTATSDTYRGILPGTVIDERYRIIERLGEGGMGVVLRVEHVRMGKVMALKVLRADLAAQPEVLERFRAEARIVSRLSHPNTISVFDFGELEGGLYIAMEYVKGRDLARILASEGRLEPVRAATLAIQVLRSLEEAHEAGIVHRDIKPANVMVIQTRAGEDWAKVVDFGIAKLNEAASRPSSKHITGVAEFVGTPNYVAPEQARGQALDARTDLYSLGAMLFELCTGKPPFEAPTPMAVVARHLSDPPPSARGRVGEIPEGLDAAITRAMAKSPADRFQSALEMRKALEAVVGSPIRTFSGQAIPAIDGYEIASREDWDQFERALLSGIRRRMLTGVAVVLALLGVGGFLGYRKLTAPAARVVLTEEAEPNDAAGKANLIALDATVHGAIGESHNPGRSDLDTYELEVPSAGQLSVSLSGVQDLNLVLELFDAAKEQAHQVDALSHVTVDDGRLSQGELLENVPVHPGRYFLRVSERPAYDAQDPNRPPRERANAPYALLAHLAPATELDEAEPNDLWSLAQPLGFAQPVLGHAGYPLPQHALERNLVLAAFDYFSAPKSKETVYAFAVQPPDRALGLWDASKLQAWRVEADAFSAKKTELERRVREGDGAAERELKRLAGPFVSAPVRANPGGVAVLRLEGAADGKAGVLVAPLSGAAPAVTDAPYGIALAHAGPGGMEAVLSLARELSARQRAPAARALLESAQRALPDAADSAELKAALDAIR